MDGATPWTIRPDGLSLKVRLTPKSSREGIDQIETLSDGTHVLKVRVRALPEDGEANAALLRCLSKALRLPSSALKLTQGGKSRTKTVMLLGDGEAIARSLQESVASATKG